MKKILKYIPFFVGIFLLAWSGTTTLKRVVFIITSEKTDGVVIGDDYSFTSSRERIIKRKGGGRQRSGKQVTVRHPVIRYVDNSKNIKTFKGIGSNDYNRMPIGTKVDVVYKPNGEAMVYSFVNLFIFPIVSGVLGLFFYLIGRIVLKAA